MCKTTYAVLGIVVVAVCGIAASIAFGRPSQPPALPSVSDPFGSIDFSDLRPVQRFTARDGSQLAYRTYMRAGGERKGVVILVHGSSSRSDSMHPLAKAFAESGYLAFTLDMRGHGQSGDKGQIAYIGQLEDDIEDFMKAAAPAGKRTLVGFSAGGGFVLRFAASARRDLFDNYLLLAPFLGEDASTYRPASGGWVSVGTPRIVALSLLNHIGISAFNHLPVTAYALRPEAEHVLTPRYSFALAMNFRPHRDYRAEIRALTRPMEVLVGDNDDQFYPDRFAYEFGIAGDHVRVSTVPSTGHVELTLTPVAVQAAVAAIGRLNAAPTVASGVFEPYPP
jgi:non-heme chloroperoxidase